MFLRGLGLLENFLSFILVFFIYLAGYWNILQNKSKFGGLFCVIQGLNSSYEKKGCWKKTFSPSRVELFLISYIILIFKCVE